MSWFGNRQKTSRARSSRKASKRDTSRWRTWVLRAVAPLLSWVVLTGASFGVVQGLRTLVAHDEHFRLEHIQTTELTDSGEIPVITGSFADTVRDVAQLEKHPQLSSVNLSRIKRKLTVLHPDVMNVLVRRVWPNTLSVFFVRRVPVAQVSAGRFFQVDREGVLLPGASGTPDPELPLIVGAVSDLTDARPGRPLSSKMLARSLQLLVEWSESRTLRALRIKTIQAFDEQSFSFSLENGIELRLGRVRLRQKVKEVMAVFAQLPGDPQQLPRYIDFRFDQVIIGPP